MQSEWADESKLDGWRAIVTRAIVTVAADRLAVRSRTGRFLTPFVPELNGLAYRERPRLFAVVA